MKIEDLKHGIEQSTAEEKIFLVAYLRHLTRKDDPVYRADLARRLDEMQSGKRFGLEQVKRAHQQPEYAAPMIPLRRLMDEISDNAEKRGLTPELADALSNRKAA